jgi:hypothetical protein
VAGNFLPTLNALTLQPVYFVGAMQHKTFLEGE